MPYMCLNSDGSKNYTKLLEHAEQQGFVAIAVPVNCISIPLEFHRAPLCHHQTDNTYADLLMNSEQWNMRVICKLSDEVDCDSNDFSVRRYSEEILKRDIQWAEHLQNGGYMMLRLKSDRVINLARVVSSHASKGYLLVQVPVFNSKIPHSAWRRDVNVNEIEQEQEVDTWQWWNAFRKAIDFDSKVKVVLEFNPDERPSEDVVRRWLGEPVEAIIIPTSMFVHNRSNYPVLPRAWQDIFAHFVRHNTNFIISGLMTDNYKEMTNYLTNFCENSKSTHELQNFDDLLEIPLQPLYENLDCYTYEIFEKDPVKYKIYQNAIEEALLDRVPKAEIETTLTVIMVLGAGRGPLVRSALNAAENTKRKVRIYIIEKNPNAIRTLSGITKKLWSNKDIRIFSKDMREFSPNEKADIIVSELLGSFGDNELSPECLDCAQRLLKPDGISIPCKSTSFMNPVMSQRLFNSVRNLGQQESFSRNKKSYYTHAETGFVSLLKNVYHISKPQPVFEFHHPNREEIVDNSRFKTLRFKATLDCLLNGLAGYFDMQLYKQHSMSINPLDHTLGLSSWFPMYFPFSNPIDIKKGDIIEVQIWRCVSKQKIWYEWCLTSPIKTHFHNHKGNSWPIYCS